MLAACVAPMPLVFDDGHDPEEVVSGLLDAVQGRFRDAALYFPRVLRRRWTARKIALEAVPC